MKKYTHPETEIFVSNEDLLFNSFDGPSDRPVPGDHETEVDTSGIDTGMNVS